MIEYADRQRVSGVELTRQETERSTPPTPSFWGIQPQTSSRDYPIHPPISPASYHHSTNHQSHRPHHNRPPPNSPSPSSSSACPLTPRLPNPRYGYMPPAMRNRRVPRLASVVRRLAERYRLRLRLLPAPLGARKVRRRGGLGQGVVGLCEVEPELGGPGGLALLFVFVLSAGLGVGSGMGWCWGWC